MSIRIACVITTISDGLFLLQLEPWLAAVRDVLTLRLYVVADLNTNSDCEGNALKLQERVGQVTFLSVLEQRELLRRLGGGLESFIPYRSDARRNIGFLAALADGFDVVLSMDDDNFPLTNQFFIEHGRTGTQAFLPASSQEGQWFNAMTLLSCSDGRGVATSPYPRGFPYARRFVDSSSISQTELLDRRIAVTAGLWLGDPDVDACTRMALRPRADGFCGRSIFLSPSARSPINTQNTSIVADAVTAYFFPDLDVPVSQMRVRRFGDIFSGLFLQLCAEAVGDGIKFGSPLVRQVRNAHSDLVDLTGELPGMTLIEALIPFFEQNLRSHTCYEEAYREVADLLDRQSQDKALAKISGAKDFLTQMTCGMREWMRACGEVRRRS